MPCYLIIAKVNCDSLLLFYVLLLLLLYFIFLLDFSCNMGNVTGQLMNRRIDRHAKNDAASRKPQAASRKPQAATTNDSMTTIKLL